MTELLKAPTACKQPPWQATLDRIDAAKILKVLGKRKKKAPPGEPGCMVPRELLP